MTDIPQVWWSPDEGRVLVRREDLNRMVVLYDKNTEIPDNAIQMTVPAHREVSGWTDDDFRCLFATEPPDSIIDGSCMSGRVRRWFYPGGRVRTWREGAERGVWTEAAR